MLKSFDRASDRSATLRQVDGVILVIDDNPATRETFRRMLEGEGYTVRVAGTVVDGLAAAAQECPAGILLDLHMPITDGLECLRQLRASKQWATVPVAILTGDYFLEESIADELGAFGVAVYFKPVWDDDLRRIVEQLLAR
jgi:two-component system response regulator MprA